MNMSRIGCETKFRNTVKKYVTSRRKTTSDRAHVNEGEAAVEGRSGDWGEVVTR